MLISQNWITRLLGATNPGWSVTPAELDQGFVRVGFETEGYAPIEETTGPLVIGRVAEIEELTGFKKPIRYCQLDVGDANGTGEKQGIICGARNFSQGSYVIVALPGAVLPGGFEIAARKTYDHISNGMICSAAELGLASKQTSGIIDLGQECELAPGTDARDLLGLDDTIFDVNVTPDRGYALSARGLTRELAAAFELNFTDVAEDPSVAGLSDFVASVPKVNGDVLGVDLAPETKAKRFGLRKVTGIDPSAESPWWLQRELMVCGARPVNLATDVTNYVMFLTGQPMHAFDAEKITGDLSVRLAKKGETFTTLDHTERTLETGDVVITDESGIQSLAGIMGGLTSEIGADTTSVYLEAASWDNLTVARTARRLKLSSEASRRFERGVDPALVEVALDMAAGILAAAGHGSVDEGRTLVGKLETPAAIELSAHRPGEIAGVEYPRETVVDKLEQVGCQVAGEGDTLLVTPPTWRGDLTAGIELVEEVVRLAGIEQIPSIIPIPTKAGRGLTPAQRRRRAIGHALAYNGYSEILPFPFVSPEVFDSFELDVSDPRREAVSVQNPLEADKNVLATTLLPGLLEALGRNINRGRTDVSLFAQQQVVIGGKDTTPMLDVSARPSDEELASVLDSLPQQPLYVATLGMGTIDPAGPWGEGRVYAWADAVESAQIVAQAAGVELEVAKAEYLPWHPGRCAELRAGGEVVGHAGELHPQILERLELPGRVCAMELNIDELPYDAHLPAPVLSSFPVLHQDIALVVDEDIAAEAVRKVLAAHAGDLLESVELFDVYRSESLGEKRKSLAFALAFRAPDRTLTDEEVNEARLQAAAAAREELGAEIRE